MFNKVLCARTHVRTCYNGSFTVTIFGYLIFFTEKNSQIFWPQWKKSKNFTVKGGRGEMIKKIHCERGARWKFSLYQLVSKKFTVKGARSLIFLWYCGIWIFFVRSQLSVLSHDWRKEYLVPWYPLGIVMTEWRLRHRHRHPRQTRANFSLAARG